MLRASRALLTAALLCTGACALSSVARGAQPASSPIASGWTPASALSECGGERPTVVFPFKEPPHASGPGAVVWNAAGSCSGGAGVRLAQLSEDDAPRPALQPHYSDGANLAAEALAAAPAPNGEIAILATARAGEEVIEGRADGPFSRLALASGFAAPFAFATGWLGDFALLAPPSSGPASGAPRLHVERFFSHAFVRNQELDTEAGSLGAVAVALDYRTDALTAWEHDGVLYAQELPGKGAPKRAQRVASVSSRITVAALLSDDYRGIIAWSEQRAGRTSVWLDQSSVGVRFGAPQLLARFSDPAGVPPPPASPRLIRLSDESVMLAWAAVAEGHWVVRTAAIDQHGVGAASTIAGQDGGDALLCGLAAGPYSEALVLWSEPQPGEDGRPDLGSQAIFAARGLDAHPRRTIFGPSEEVAAPGPNSEATVALDPTSGRALAVWRNAGTLQYAVRASG